MPSGRLPQRRGISSSAVMARIRLWKKPPWAGAAVELAAVVVSPHVLDEFGKVDGRGAAFIADPAGQAGIDRRAHLRRIGPAGDDFAGHEPGEKRACRPGPGSRPRCICRSPGRRRHHGRPRWLQGYPAADRSRTAAARRPDRAFAHPPHLAAVNSFRKSQQRLGFVRQEIAQVQPLLPQAQQIQDLAGIFGILLGRGRAGAVAAGTGLHPISSTPSAPISKALNSRALLIRPLQGMRTILISGGNIGALVLKGLIGRMGSPVAQKQYDLEICLASINSRSPAMQQLFQGLFQIGLIPERAVRRIGRTDRNAVAAPFAQGLVHHGRIAAVAVRLQGDGLIGAGLADSGRSRGTGASSITTEKPRLWRGPRGMAAAASTAAASPLVCLEIWMPGGSARKRPEMEVLPGYMNGNARTPGSSALPTWTVWPGRSSVCDGTGRCCAIFHPESRRPP